MLPMFQMLRAQWFIIFKKMEWDTFLLDKLNIPSTVLPKVMPSSALFGTAISKWLGAEIPIAGIAGDQQAALFGQGCYEAGMAKNTYGTGCFMLMNTDKLKFSQAGLVSTIAWQVGDKVTYALEGSVFIAGAAVQWLRDELKILDSAADSEYFATKVADNGGVYVVPCVCGFGCAALGYVCAGRDFWLVAWHRQSPILFGQRWNL